MVFALSLMNFKSQNKWLNYCSTHIRLFIIINPFTIQWIMSQLNVQRDLAKHSMCLCNLMHFSFSGRRPTSKAQRSCISLFFVCHRPSKKKQEVSHFYCKFRCWMLCDTCSEIIQQLLFSLLPKCILATGFCVSFATNEV